MHSQTQVTSPTKTARDIVEDELAVLPADAMLYIRTSRGVIALRE
jgi:hypothetical protein